MELNFDTGLCTYTLNEKVEVCFNPTDSAFVEKLFNAFDSLDEKQEKFKTDSENISGKGVFELAKKMDADMREELDGIFGKPVCDDLFGDMNVYAMAGGLPVWCNFMLALMDVTDSKFAEERKKTDSRIAKYTAKYKKK